MKTLIVKDLIRVLQKIDDGYSKVYLACDEEGNAFGSITAKFTKRGIDASDCFSKENGTIVIYPYQQSTEI